MTSRSHISILTIAFLTIAFTSCGQVSNKKRAQIDTSKTALIPFDKKGNYPFDNSFNAATLTQDDINSIDSLFIACVIDYNNSLGKDHKEWSIDLKRYNYRKQIIAVTNKKEKKKFG